MAERASSNEITQNRSPAKKQRTKRSVACRYCRMKKVRCNGEQPCAYCAEREEECIYVPLRRRARKLFLENSEYMENRIMRMEAALREANVPLPEEDLMGSARPETLDSITTQPPRYQVEKSIEPPRIDKLPLSPHTASNRSARVYPEDGRMVNEGAIMSTSDIYQDLSIDTGDNRISGQNPCEMFQESSPTNISAFDMMAPPTTEEVPRLQTPADTPVDKGTSSIPPRESSHWEYHGPGSYLSICSPPGINWICEKAGSTDFSDIAKIFTRDITRDLKLERKIGNTITPEPNTEIAWRYCKVFFEEAPEAVYDIVFRSSFEARLRLHFASGHISPGDEDPAWYALRNAVYATGCRIEVSKRGGPLAFSESQTQSWRYFENAFSRHTELVYCRTGLMAVQAMLAMAFYVEGVACPALEYMLCSGAARLAQSRGLHRQAGTAWGMSSQEIEQRNRVFWVLYAYEKHVSCRSGRPSVSPLPKDARLKHQIRNCAELYKAIDDDDISCNLPTSLPSYNQGDLDYCIFTITHSQISSRISRQLGSIRAYRETPESIVRIACNLNQELDEWRDGLPTYLQPRPTLNEVDVPPNFHTYHAMYIAYAYWGSLIAIHSTFTYPWSCVFGRDSSSFHNQVKISTAVVAEASRNIILATKYIHTDSWSPVWLSFYFPVVGLINLFVHVLKYPTLPTARSDVVLMDILTGYFARLEFVSSGRITISFVRELSRLTRKAVKNGQQRIMRDEGKRTDNLQMGDAMSYEQLGPSSINIEQSIANTSLEYMGDFDMENWSTLLPPFSLDDMMNGL